MFLKSLLICYGVLSMKKPLIWLCLIFLWHASIASSQVTTLPVSLQRHTVSIQIKHISLQTKPQYMMVEVVKDANNKEIFDSFIMIKLPLNYNASTLSFDQIYKISLVNKGNSTHPDFEIANQNFPFFIQTDSDIKMRTPVFTALDVLFKVNQIDTRVLGDKAFITGEVINELPFINRSIKHISCLKKDLPQVKLNDINHLVLKLMANNQWSAQLPSNKKSVVL